MGWREALFCLALAAATVAAYAGVLSSEFVRYDDPRYVSQNERVLGGLSADGVVWASTAVVKSLWHPLTILSHMTDVELFGLDAGKHHATSLLFHVLNSLVLFFVLRFATGAAGPSALVAALFALHPTHVESVAWVSERKDVLSAFFGILAIGAWVGFARQGGTARYALAALALTLGLLAKPMLVTLPFVFLLLDSWPLGRLHSWGDARRLVIEKLPLFALAAAVAAVTAVSQQRSGALDVAAAVSFPDRVANAVMAYGLYVWKTLWPADLALLYPHPNLPGGTPWAVWQVAATAFVLLAVSVAVLRARARPYLAVGWLWFGGMLVPVIGLLQAGSQSMADRYTYLPAIGLYLMVAFGGAEVVRSRAALRAPLAAAAILWIALLAFASWRQVGYWRNSVTLFEHSLAVAPGSAIMHNNLGNARYDREEFETSASHYRRALEIDSSYDIVHRNLRNALRELGEYTAAEEHALAYDGIAAESAAGQVRLAAAELREGDAEASFARLRRAVELAPDSVRARRSLGQRLLQMRRFEAATVEFREALRLRDSAIDRTNLAHALFVQGELEEAIPLYRSALEAAPSDATAFRNLGDALAQRGDLAEAIVFYRQAVVLEPDAPASRLRLEGALAAASRAQSIGVEPSSESPPDGSGGR